MIDPNEAPEGYIAKPVIGSCRGCWFDKNGHCPTDPCGKRQRRDGENVIFIPREKSNIAEIANTNEMAEAKLEAERWESSHDHVCKELAACEEARDQNAELYEQEKALHEITRLGGIRHLEELIQTKDELKRWQDIAAQYSQEREHNANEALRWKAECRDLTDLVAKLKAQLTAALEAIKRSR